MRVGLLVLLLLGACDDDSGKPFRVFDLSHVAPRDLSMPKTGSSSINVSDTNGAFPAINITVINCVTSPGFYFSFPLDQLATPLQLTQPIYGGVSNDGAGGTLFYISAGNGAGYPYSGDVNPFTVSAAGGTLPKATLTAQTGAKVPDSIIIAGPYSCN